MAKRVVRTIVPAAFILTSLAVGCAKSSTEIDIGTGSDTNAPVAVTNTTTTATPAPDPAAETPTTTVATTTTTAGTKFSVTVGQDSGPDRRETVPVGSFVTLTVSNPASDDEFHLHGYDLELKVKAGEPAVFSFSAGTAGTYELESHVTSGVLLTLEVA